MYAQLRDVISINFLVKTFLPVLHIHDEASGIITGSLRFLLYSL